MANRTPWRKTVRFEGYPYFVVSYREKAAWDDMPEEQKSLFTEEWIEEISRKEKDLFDRMLINYSGGVRLIELVNIFLKQSNGKYDPIDF